MIPDDTEQDIDTSVEPQQDSIRDSLEAAFDAAEPADPATPTTAADPQDSGSADATSADPAADSNQPARPRDDKGKFVAKAKGGEGDLGAASIPAPEKAGGATAPSAPPLPAQTAAPAAAAPTEKAPQAWKPAAREHWAKLPPEVREETVRREREHAQFMQQTAGDRKVAQQFNEAVAPFMHMIQAEGAEPISAVRNLMQTAAALRTAPPNQRAGIVAQIIQAYNVPIESLDQILAGQPAPQGQPQAQQQQQQQYHDPRLDQLLYREQQREQQRVRAITERGQSEVAQFKASNEFAEDVSDLMADLMEVAAKRGEQMTLADAYQRAVAARPDIFKIVQQRQAAGNAAKARASTQRSRQAAVSVKGGSPVTPGTSREPSSIREALEEAFDSVGGR